MHTQIAIAVMTVTVVNAQTEAIEMVVIVTEIGIVCRIATETVIVTATANAIDMVAVEAGRTMDASDLVRMTALMTIALGDDTKCGEPSPAHFHGPRCLPAEPRLAGGYPCP